MRIVELINKIRTLKSPARNVFTGFVMEREVRTVWRFSRWPFLLCDALFVWKRVAGNRFGWRNSHLVEICRLQEMLENQ